MNPYLALLADWTPARNEFESAHLGHAHHVAVLAVFDHDWQHHLLVQQCSTGPVAAALGMDEWTYALYLVSDGPVLIHTFFDRSYADGAPWVEAAALVSCWSRSGHYDGRSNAFESDTFLLP